MNDGKNIVMGSGHSYFGQLYDHGFSEMHQYLRVVPYDYVSIINEMEDSGKLIDPFRQDKITHLSCGTFSTTIVMNDTKVYSCGEITPFKKELSFELDIQPFLGNDKILQVFHLDTGIAFYTSSECFIMLEKPDIYTRIENVAKMVGGHLSNDTYYVLKDSPNTLRRWVSTPSTDEPLSYSLSNIPSPFHFVPGYYHILCISQGKYIYTDASFLDEGVGVVDEEEDFELTLSTLVGPKSQIGDKDTKLLTRLILKEGYCVKKISSGSDFSFVLVYHESSKEQEEMKNKLHNQSSRRNSFIDMSIVCLDFQLY